MSHAKNKEKKKKINKKKWRNGQVELYWEKHPNNPIHPYHSISHLFLHLIYIWTYCGCWWMYGKKREIEI